MSHQAIAVKEIPPKQLRLRKIRGESPTGYLALRASLRLWILDLKAEKAVNGSKRFGILSPNAPLGRRKLYFRLCRLLFTRFIELRLATCCRSSPRQPHAPEKKFTVL